MSRIASSPVVVPVNVNVKLSKNSIEISGVLGNLQLSNIQKVEILNQNGYLNIQPLSADKASIAMSGTVRSLVQNMVTGVTVGFEKKLQLVGVGYKAQVVSGCLNLSLGFSHPVVFELPEGVEVSTPTPTEIVLKSSDKQLLGQVAAKIRSFRPPEPYKGKGVRYVDEKILLKEVKKK